jgi:hypothetical protein
MPFDSGLSAGVVIGTRIESLGRAERIERGVDAAVITQPLDRRIGSLVGADAVGHGPLHEQLDVRPAEIAGRGDRGQRFPIVAIERKAHLHDLPIPARDLEHVGAPAFVRHLTLNQAPMCTTRSPAHRPRQLPPGDLHHAPDALEIVLRVEGPIDQRPDAAGAVRSPCPDHRPDPGLHDAILGPHVARSAWPTHGICTRPTNAEHATDGRPLVPRHRLDAP